MSTQPQPTPPIGSPAVPPKPFKVSRWLILGLVVIVLIYLISTILRYKPEADTKNASVINGNQHATAPGDVADFLHMGGANYALIMKKRAQLAAEMKAIGITDEEDIKALLASLPECNAAKRQELNGRSYLAVNQRTQKAIQFNCGTDNSWHPVPYEKPQIDPPTPAQKKAIGGGPHRDTEKEKREAALDAALRSSSVFDFLETSEKRNAALSSGAPLGERGAEARGSEAAQEAAASGGIKDPPGKDPKINDWSSATGPMYRLFEDDVIETLLVNRIGGEQSGPVVVMVTTNVYSHDNQVLLIKKGTRILGEASRVSANGQRRLAVTFHRIVMPDGYSKNLAITPGLDQQGETGLTGKVNTHWAKVLASAVLVGAIGGLSNVGGYGGYGNGFDPVDGIRVGVTQQSGQSAMHILDRGLNALPTVEVIEGSRVKVMVKEDFLLPAYENHTVSPIL